VEMNTKVIYDDLRNPVSIEGVFRDVTERKEYEKQLEQMAIVFDTAVESIIILNSKGIIEKVNPAFTVITGYKPAEIIGKSPKILRSEKHKESFYIGIQKKLFRTGLWQGEIWNRKVNGETYPEWLSVTCIKDNTGSILHYVLVGHDITELKRSEEKLKHQVYHDSLTGLPNRELLKDRIDMALAYSTRHKTKLAILFIDLDNFKNINDTAGHQVGDVYLRKIAEMLSCSCREEDTVSRIGGDEFVILLPDAEHDNSAEKVAKRIFKAFNTHVVIDEYKLSPSASIGISIFPENGNNPTDLLRAADMAMYHSKEKGKGSYAFYQPDMDTSDIDKLSIEANIRKGIKNNEFLMHYQPVVSLSDGRVKGFEALVRWQKSDGTLIPPAQFINVAEESHLIHKLGDFVLKETCEAMKKISKIGYKQLSFSVNVSSKQFQNYNFVENVIKTVKETGIKAEKLILEITENTVVNDINTAIRTMKELKEQGIRMSLDDFGTGYSSLAYLKEFPVSILKIDRTFTKGIFEDRSEKHITKSIVGLAKNFNMLVVAEGVEEKRQVEYLQSIGCNFIQGFYFGKPMPENEVVSLLKSGRKLQL